MNDGRVLTGAIHPMKSVAELPGEKKKPEQGVQTEKIVVIDDQLRRIYVSKGSIRDILPDELTPTYELFRLPQRVNRNESRQVAALNSYKTTTPFDSFGRRTLMAGGSPLVQGISEIAPNYLRVDGLNYYLDMRLSPHSIPRKTLSSLIRKNINPKSLDDRLRIYQFYVQAELYEQAGEELQEIINDFQDEQGSTDRLEVGLRMIRQLAADRLIRELDFRRQAGQFKKVRDLLKSFESKGVSQEKIQTIRRMLADYDEQDKKRIRIIEKIKAIHSGLQDEGMKDVLAPLVNEIEKQLNLNTMDRFSEFLLSEQDAGQNDQSRLAIALSSWLGGNMSADTRLEIAISMYKVRQLSRKYLLESIPSQREELWREIQSEEASNPERMARILMLMKPPQSTRRSASSSPLFYELETPSFRSEQTIKYYVQLPPEYDPNRTYPTIITLHGERTTAQTQLSWWSGPWVKRQVEKGKETFERLGQATRHGYIVIAPVWNKPGLPYDYSADAHAAVLYTYRDALKRFAIDTDRVFLSGHSSGGDAAWDIGLSHPDLWAGIVPICGVAEKFSYLLRRNIAWLSVYSVCGELDGASLLRSRDVLDWGLDRTKVYDITCVQYKGRGRESFADELTRIFEWMQLRNRSFFNKDEREVYTVRPWDNFFWSAELFGFPLETLVDPSFWLAGKPGNERASKTTFFKIAGNSMKIRSNADKARIFLSPELLDFQQRGEVLFNMKKISPANGIFVPSSKVILEDARTRCDRKHPFWAVLSSTQPGEMNFWDK